MNSFDRHYSGGTIQPLNEKLKGVYESCLRETIVNWKRIITEDLSLSNRNLLGKQLETHGHHHGGCIPRVKMKVVHIKQLEKYHGKVGMSVWDDQI